jgi:hypothetical protein
VQEKALEAELEQQLEQLEKLLGLIDAESLRAAQQAVEERIARLKEQLELLRQALAEAQRQQLRIARARLLLEERSTAEADRSDGADAALEPARSAADVLA